MTLGHVGLIGLLYRVPALSGAMRTLAAVGQMALTNYLSQSLICMFLFTGAGLALFGQLERHELYYVVVAIWIVQLIWSPLWLRRFRFGPAEWLWRSLTYWQRQPMRIESDRSAPSDQVRVFVTIAVTVASAAHAAARTRPPVVRASRPPPDRSGNECRRTRARRRRPA